MPGFKEAYIPDWRRYPIERCVMSKEKHRRFVEYCRKVGKPKSRVINLLIDKLIAGEVTV